jgi:ribonuclease HI
VNLVIHIDGGARGNPGLSGFGVHVCDSEGVFLKGLYGFIGIQTNNVAEYSALVVALRHAVDVNATSLLIRSDSELLVKQMKGQYRVKSPGLLPLYRESKALAGKLPKVRLEHVPRAQNKDADALANVAMDSRGEDPAGVSAGIPLPRPAGIPELR